MTIDLSHVINYLSLALGLIGFVWLLFRLVNRWDDPFTTAMRAMMLSLLVYSIAAVYISAHAAVEHIDLDLSIISLLVAQGSLLYGLWETRNMTVAMTDIMGTNEGDGHHE